MRLISCENCGTVLDTDRIPEPVIYDDSDNYIEGNSTWFNCKYEPIFRCRACDHKIFYANGNWA